MRPRDARRLQEAIEAAWTRGGGRAELRVDASDSGDVGRGHRSRAGLVCPKCARAFEPPRPGLFSYNSPLGACDACRGFGRIIAVDWDKVIPDPNKTLADGAIKPWSGREHEWERGDPREVLQARRDPASTCRGATLTEAQRALVIDGEGTWKRGQVPRRARVVRVARDAHVQDARARAPLALPRVRPLHGVRRRRASTRRALAYRVAGLNLAAWHALDGERGARARRARSRRATPQGKRVQRAARVAPRLPRRGRASATSRSTGRRARSRAARRSARALTTALGAALTGTLFVLDEPTVGLHATDVPRARARRCASSRARATRVLVVEHEPADRARVRSRHRAGPGRRAARRAHPLRRDARASSRSARTCRPGAPGVGRRRARRARAGRRGAWLEVRGAREHNLRGRRRAHPARRRVRGHRAERLGQVHARRRRRSTAPSRARLGDFSRRPARARTTRSTGSGSSRAPCSSISRRSGAPRAATRRRTRRRGTASARASPRSPRPRARGLTAAHFSFNVPRGPLRGRARARATRPSRCSSSPTCSSSARSARASASSPRCSRSRTAARSIADVLAMTRRRGARALRPGGATATTSCGARSTRSCASGSGTCRSGSRSRRSRAARRSGSSSRARSSEDAEGHALRRRRAERRAPRRGRGARRRRARTRSSTRARASSSSSTTSTSIRAVRLGHRPRPGRRPARRARRRRRARPQEVAKTDTRTGRRARESAYATRSTGTRKRRTLRRRRRSRRRAIGVVARARAQPEGGVVRDPARQALRRHGAERLGQVLARVRRRLRRGAAPLHGDADAVRAAVPAHAAAARRRQRDRRAAVDRARAAHLARRRELHGRDGDRGRALPAAALREGRRAALPEVRRGRRADARRRALRAARRVARARTQAHALRARGAGAQRARTSTSSPRRRARASRPRASTARIVAIDPPPKLAKTKEHTIDLIVYYGTLADARSRDVRPRARVGQRAPCASREGAPTRQAPPTAEQMLSTTRACPRCGTGVPELDPRWFSFNTKQGQCEACEGTGVEGGPATLEEDEGRTSRARRATGSRLSARPARRAPVRRDVPRDRRARDVASALARVERVALRRARRRVIAEGAARGARCGGSRSCEQVGLGYLALDRPAATLSGGEMQRLRLSAQLGSGLTGALYVLDEPTIGLHPRDTGRLLANLRALADMGSTVLVVEHDAETIRAADHSSISAPAGGRNGGHIVAEGPAAQVLADPRSPTGARARGDGARRSAEAPDGRRVDRALRRARATTCATSTSACRSGACASSPA